MKALFLISLANSKVFVPLLLLLAKGLGIHGKKHLAKKIFTETIKDETKDSVKDSLRKATQKKEKE